MHTCFGNHAFTFMFQTEFLPLCFRSSVSLSPVFKPVTHLSGSESSLLSQLSLFSWARIGILLIPLPENDSRFLLEAVTRLLSVPDSPWQGELSPDPVLSYSSQRLATQSFCLDIVCLQPKLLHARVRLRRKVVTFDDAVELLEIALVESDKCSSLEHTLVFLDLLASWQAPQESCKSFNVSTLL